jgi:hypothetical protein
MSVAKAFNNVLIQFMDDCMMVFPEEKEFKKYKRGAEVLKEYNPKKVPTIFKEYAKLYREKIDKRDETFFLENEYSDIQEDNELIGLIDKIKKYWKNLTEDNKDKIWKYIEVLVKLSDKI